MSGFVLYEITLGLEKNLSMLADAEKDQITGNEDQDQGNSSQIDVCLHKLSPFVKKIICDDQYDTAHNCRENIGIDRAPFDHCFVPLAKDKENTKNETANINDKPNEKTKSNCPVDNFSIDDNYSTSINNNVKRRRRQGNYSVIQTGKAGRSGVHREAKRFVGIKFCR